MVGVGELASVFVGVGRLETRVTIGLTGSEIIIDASEVAVTGDIAAFSDMVGVGETLQPVTSNNKISLSREKFPTLNT